MPRILSCARVVIFGVALAFAFGVISRSASAQRFITFNYPGAPQSAPNLINNRGEMVGSYYSTFGVDNRGFTLLNGQFTAIDFPGAVQTIPDGANDSGVVVGYYVDSGGVEHGFLLNDGSYSTIDFPGATSTLLISINNAGEIVGSYSIGPTTVSHGFSLKAGVFTTVDFPGSNRLNVPNQVNNFGVIAGWYTDANSIQHGYVYNAGIFTPINFPGASNTGVNAINDSDELSGAECAAATCQGFTYLNGQFTTVNFPASLGEIINLAINNAGQLAAAYVDSAGNFHGAVSAIGPFAYVPNYTPGTLSIFDTTLNLLLTTVPVGPGAYDAATSPNGRFVYVSNYQGASVSVIDTNLNAVVATVPVGVAPAGIASAPDGSKVYVANHFSNSVSIISTISNTVVSAVAVGQSPLGLAATPDGKYVFVANQSSPGISRIDVATMTASTIPVGFGTAFVAISPDSRFAYLTGNGVSKFEISTSTIIGTIPIGAWYVSVSPDGSTGYVSDFVSSVAVVDLATSTEISRVQVGTTPQGSALTPDGTFLWQANSNSSFVSVIETLIDSVTANVPVAGGNAFVAIGPAPPTSRSITQPLSPTAPNTFNFGPHNFTVTYPAGTSFSGVNMTVVGAQATQQTFAKRVAGTAFANAVCIVYSGAGGNCVDYQVTCSTTSGSQITCPNESAPTITVKTSYDTQQQIINPGFLTTPIETNAWTNIFTAFYLQRIDPTTKGRTSGFSEFVAVDLGATNREGAGNLQFLPPLQQNGARIFPVGTIIPVKFQLTAIAQPSESITDATAGITVVKTSDANGNPTSSDVLDKSSAFAYTGGDYVYSLNTSGYAPGTYNLTIYGNAFAAQQVQFTLPAATSGAHLITTLQSLTLNSTTNQYVATISVSNTGTAAANGLIVTASELNVTATSTVLPVSLGNISSNGSATAALTYPASAGAAGSRGVWTIGESFAGGSTGAAIRVVLP
jgi:YVTN family beta-propeller protein